MLSVVRNGAFHGLSGGPQIKRDSIIFNQQENQMKYELKIWAKA